MHDALVISIIPKAEYRFNVLSLFYVKENTFINESSIYFEDKELNFKVLFFCTHVPSATHILQVPMADIFSY
jgi:hypothetical protein